MKNPKIFETHGKRRIHLIIDQINEFTEDAYKIAGVTFTEKDGIIEAGYEISLNGKVSQYCVDDVQIPSMNLSTSLKINSNPIYQDFEKGIFGSGVFESEKCLEMEISVKPWVVKDITHELRSNKERGFRIDGFLLNDKVFRIAYFLLFTSEKGY